MAKQVTREQMLRRVARFKELRPSKQAFVDTRLPGHERDIFNVIGRGVTEDPELAPAIADPRDFNVAYVGADPGKGAALHAHPTVEVFIPLSGRWAIYWGDEGEEEVVLEPWDVISVPPGVMRGFRNAGTEHAFMMAVLGGTDAGKVVWSKKVLERATASGLSLDAEGNLVELGASPR
jgi:mannose-6-phosphate isomerase-like protein (cupin superfamily)